MISLITATSINEDEFDRVYEASVDSMNNGSYPWSAYPHINSDEEKKAHIRNLYDFERDGNLIIEVRKGGLLVGLLLGQWHGQELKITAALIAPDASGSKSWLYSAETQAARNAYWQTLGVVGWTGRTTGAKSPMYQHVKKRIEANAIHASTAEKTIEVQVPQQLVGVVEYDPITEIIIAQEDE